MTILPESKNILHKCRWWLLRRLAWTWVWIQSSAVAWKALCARGPPHLHEADGGRPNRRTKLYRTPRKSIRGRSSKRTRTQQSPPRCRSGARCWEHGKLLMRGIKSKDAEFCQKNWKHSINGCHYGDIRLKYLTHSWNKIGISSSEAIYNFRIEYPIIHSLFIVTGFTIKFEDNKVLSLILTATRMQEMILIMKHFGSDKRLGKVLYQSDKRRRFHLFTIPQ